VIHYYDKISVAVVRLDGKLKIGDTIIVRGGETEFEQTIDSMQVNHQNVDSGKKDDEVAIKLEGKAREGYAVFRKS